MLQHVAARCSALLRVAACCSVLQCYDGTFRSRYCMCTTLGVICTNNPGAYKRISAYEIIGVEMIGCACGTPCRRCSAYGYYVYV